MKTKTSALYELAKNGDGVRNRKKMDTRSKNVGSASGWFRATATTLATDKDFATQTSMKLYTFVLTITLSNMRQHHESSISLRAPNARRSISTGDLRHLPGQSESREISTERNICFLNRRAGGKKGGIVAHMHSTS